MRQTIALSLALLLFGCQSELGAAPDVPANEQGREEGHEEVMELSKWHIPDVEVPVLVGTVSHPNGEPLEGIEVKAYSGLATRFLLESVKTDALGHYRFVPAQGMPIPAYGDRPAQLFVGLSVGSVTNINPPEVLPWKDIYLDDAPGVVVVVDFVFDPESVPGQYRD